MSTTIDDVLYEEYLEDLHNLYVGALEQFARSKSLDDLRENLKSVQDMKANSPELMTEDVDQLRELEGVLKEITNLEEIYKILIQEKRENKIYFFVGLLVGLIVTILSSLFL